MMQYCKLKSDIKVCSLFPLGLEDYFILLGERINGTCDVIQIDGCESYPIKYTSTWVKNIILFDNKKNAEYNKVDRPIINFINESVIEINYRNSSYKLLYDNSDMVFSKNSKVKIIDPTSQFYLKCGEIIEVIDSTEWLETHDFIPRYLLELKSHISVFVDHYQIEIVK